MFLSSGELRALHLRKDLRTSRNAYLSTRLQRIQIDNHRAEYATCKFHSSGDYILSSNFQGEIYICATDGSCDKMAYLKGHTKSVNDLRFSTDETEIYSVSSDKSIGIWDSMRGFRKAVVTGHTDCITSVSSTCAESKLLCTGSLDQTVRLWDLRVRQCTAKSLTDSYVKAVCFSACGNYVFSGGNHCGIDVRDIRVLGGQCLVGRGPCAEVTGITLSPCGNYLAVCDFSGLLKWQTDQLIEEPSRCTTYHFHKSRRTLRCSAWSADGSRLAALNSRIDLLVIDSRTADTVRRLEPHGCIIEDVAFHPKKRILMSAGEGIVLQEY